MYGLHQMPPLWLPTWHQLGGVRSESNKSQTYRKYRRITLKVNTATQIGIYCLVFLNQDSTRIVGYPLLSVTIESCARVTVMSTRTQLHAYAEAETCEEMLPCLSSADLAPSRVPHPMSRARRVIPVPSSKYASYIYSKLFLRRSGDSSVTGRIVTVHWKRRLWRYTTRNDHWHIHVTQDKNSVQRRNGELVTTGTDGMASTLPPCSAVTVERE
jgi:hypothetical protein